MRQDGGGNRWNQAFSFDVFLRTGRLMPGQNIETKFNPWHDPANGRFTFARTGRYFGRGSSQKVTGGGGRFGGAGATGSWDQGNPRPKPGLVPRKTPAPTRLNGPASRLSKPTAPPPIRRQVPLQEGWRRVVRNGYEYQIDNNERTRRVTGVLSLNSVQSRSRSAQAGAGGPDRRATDDGGHYIARRFNGPTDAFNHFAQDANFNRGGYRALEDRWARAIQSGKAVFVRISPSYDGPSRRPMTVTVSFLIGRQFEERDFPNEMKGKRHGR